MRLIGSSILICLSSFFHVSAHAQTQSQPSKPIPKQQTPQQKPKPSPVVVSGQVFVVTKGGQNIKLALVSVSAYLVGDVTKQVAAIEEAERPLRAAARQELARLESELVEVKAQESELKAKYDNLRNRWLNSNYRDPMKDQYQRETSAAMMEWTNYMVKPLDKAREVDRAKSLVARLSGIRNYIESLSSPVDTTKTDADGVFELNIPPGRYIITAVSRRQVAGDLELYEWAVEIEVRGAVKKFMLSNDNMWSRNCDDCLKLPVMQ